MINNFNIIKKKIRKKERKREKKKKKIIFNK